VFSASLWLPAWWARRRVHRTPIQAAAGNFKVLLENDRARVLDFHAKAGEKIPTHSHAAYI
jgi:hypothetical protein